MGTEDKIRNRADEAKGKMKERAGEATDDEQMAAEGRVETAEAKGKEAVDHVSETASGLAENVRDSARRER